MTGRKYDDKMNLDMPFAEALERFVGVDPREMHANIARRNARGSEKRLAEEPAARSGSSPPQTLVAVVRRIRPSCWGDCWGVSIDRAKFNI